jgi:hypothetical protein
MAIPQAVTHFSKEQIMINPDLPLERSPSHVQMIEGYVERSEFNPT